MYSNKHRFEKIEELNGHNPIYDGMEGRVCYPAYLKVGERGWLLYENEVDDWLPVMIPHRLHTSVIKNVIYNDDSIIVATENTILVLGVVKE